MAAAKFEALPDDAAGEIFDRLHFRDVARLRPVSRRLKALIGRLRDRINSARLCFFQVRLYNGDHGELVGIDEHGRYKLFLSIRDILQLNALMVGEQLRLLSATGKLFLFLIYPHRETLLILNPFNRTFRKLHWPFEITDVTLMRSSEIKFTVASAELMHFQIIYVEFHGNQPVHFTYDSVADRWYRRVAQIVYHQDQLDPTDSRALFLMTQMRTYFISFGDINSRLPLCLLLPPTFGQALLDPLLPYRQTPGWTDVWVKGFFQKYMILINDSSNVLDQRIRVIKAIYLFQVRDDLTGFHYVSLVPANLLRDIQDHDRFELMSIDMEEYGGILSLSILRFTGTYRVFRFEYNIIEDSWSEAQSYRVFGVGGMRFIHQLDI